MPLFKDVSMLNEHSWTYAGANQTDETNEGIATGHSVIKITPNHYYYAKSRNDLQAVVGVTLNQVQVGIQSEWTEMGIPKLPLINSLGSGLQSLSDTAALAGGGELGAVYASKKLWRKNGDLTISPEFRVVDWDGSGRPLRAAYQIAKFCVPGKPFDVKQKISDLVDEVERQYKNQKNNIKDKTKDNTKIKNAIDIIGKKRNEAIDGIVNMASQTKALAGETGDSVAARLVTVTDNVLDGAHDLITLKNAPPPVKVQIGQYFYHPDMVITNASFNFSKEVSDLGPLYVDITLSVSSRRIISGLNDIGFVNVNNLNSRVEIKNNTVTR